MIDRPLEKSYPSPTSENFLTIALNDSKDCTRYPFSHCIMCELYGLLARWERIMWFGGFMKMVNDVSTRGWSMKTDSGTEFLAYAMAGRVLCNVNHGDVTLSWVCDDSATYPRAGYNTVNGDIDVVHMAMGDIITAWAAGQRPVVADNVSI